jgi:hypothetical protein
MLEKSPGYQIPWEKQRQKEDAKAWATYLKQKQRNPDLPPPSFPRPSFNINKKSLKRKASDKGEKREKTFDLVKYLWNEWYLTHELWAFWPRQMVSM